MCIWAPLLLPQLLIVSLPAVSLFCTSSSPSSTPLPRGRRLRSLAENITSRNFHIGYASSSGFLDFEDEYTDVASAEFNILTCENDMKFDQLQPQRGVFDFRLADQHVAFATAHGMLVHGHALIWHSQNPSFLYNETWTQQELLDIMEQHIEMVVGHYKGTVEIWDVVNEPLIYDGSLRETLWLQTIGPGYIAFAFQLAHAVDPMAVLILNDYGVLDMNPKSNATYELVKDLLRDGTPIHGVGFQAHLSAHDDIPNYDSVAENMKRFADLGLEIYITELDVRIKNDADDEFLFIQASVYENVVRICLEQQACRAVQTWGFTDKDTWIPDHDPGFGRPLLFDENYEAKPAYYAVQSVLAQYLQQQQQQQENIPSSQASVFNEVQIILASLGAWIAYRGW